jgi:hypothetical protein
MMDVLINNILPLCLSAIGGAMMIISIYAIIGKADNLLDFEKKHFSAKAAKTITNLKGILGVLFAGLLFFCASALLFNKKAQITVSLILIGGLTFVFFVIYDIFWFKKGKKK